jgi:endo-1,4-beta-xylanase
MKIVVAAMYAAPICLAQRGTAQSITSNQIGSQGGYTYEYWKDKGTGRMTLGPDGAFSVTWSNIGNLLVRKGLRPGSKQRVVTYSADYQPIGNSYLCIYGWFTTPMVEYYIVDSWGTWWPPGATSVGTVTSDGSTYDLYQTQRVNQPSIQGLATFYQYWSVRTTKRTGGTVTIANHLTAWRSKGWPVGDLHEVSLSVEGYQSSGIANVTRMSMSTRNPTNLPRRKIQPLKPE